MAKSRKRRPKKPKEDTRSEEMKKYFKKPQAKKPRAKREKHNEYRRTEGFKETQAYRNQLKAQRQRYRKDHGVGDEEYYAS